ncbi:MAG: FAD-binding oxidoreductase [Bacteroidia bacterium]|nr:FAD-binding oxidoreductase [Bacteroidia bacterium]
MEYRISRIIQESPRVRRFFLETVNFDFIPGQFVVLTHPDLPQGDNQRSYSIASINANQSELELCIVLNEKGLITPWLFQRNVGDHLHISEAQGAFNLKNDENAGPIVFIATGTGVAPFRSMIDASLEFTHSEVHLVFGNRFQQDILYREHWEALQNEHERFHFHPVLSREKATNCAFGYVHEIYESILRDHSDARIYVCGWQDMCKEARERLKLLGFNRKQYAFEQYD